jgi:hypothetical protein
VALLCSLMAAATLGVWLDLAATQSSLTQRRWLWQSQAAAEALIRDFQSGWRNAPPVPGSGCRQGRCAWQGDAGLSRSSWSAQLGSAAGWGAFSGLGAGANSWPNIPGTGLWGWLESTPSSNGTLVRITAWVQGPDARQSSVMQAVWLSDLTGSGGQWVSWREVLP